MRILLTTVAIAALAAGATSMLRCWLDRRAQFVAARARKPIEAWENEGGALAPHHATAGTSQVPR